MHGVCLPLPHFCTHLHPHNPGPHPGPPACRIQVPWQHHRHPHRRPHCHRCRLHRAGRPHLHCRRRCRRRRRRCRRHCCWLPGGQTTSPADQALGCLPPALLLLPPCRRGAAQRRTGCEPARSRRWWPALHGSAAPRSPSLHGQHPSAGREGVRTAVASALRVQGPGVSGSGTSKMQATHEQAGQRGSAARLSLHTSSAQCICRRV